MQTTVAFIFVIRVQEHLPSLLITINLQKQPFPLLSTNEKQQVSLLHHGFVKGAPE
jgi:hypothetical protein